MMKSARKMLARLSMPVLLAVLLLISAPRVLPQQPAPKTAPPATQSPTTPADVRARVVEAPVDATVPNDPAVDKMLAVYSPKVRELEVVIGKLKGELRKGGTGAGSLGNFVTDGMRNQAGLKTGKPITLALMNAGGMRRNAIGEGQLMARDIFELLPFENALVTLDLTGEQTLRTNATHFDQRRVELGAELVRHGHVYRGSRTEWESGKQEMSAR